MHSIERNREVTNCSNGIKDSWEVIEIGIALS